MAKNYEIKTTFGAVDKTSRVLNGMESRVQKFAARSEMYLRGVDRKFARVSAILGKTMRTGFFAATASATALGGAVAGVMKQFSKVEDAEAAFTPVLGTVDKARKMVEALNQTAATTPFQFETLSGAAKQLLPNMGGDIEKTIALTRMLGDTAGGNAQKMDSIVRGYNKALLKGKVDMESLNMIAEAGVPIFQDLGKVIGLSGPKMFKAISAGEVSTEDLTKAFRKMTGQGGIFFNGMKIASETLSGRISTLKDNVGLAAAEVGSALAPTIKDLTDKLIVVAGKIRDWVTQNRELIRTKVEEYIKKISAILSEIAYWAPKIAKYIAIFYSIQAAVKVARGAMWLFNVAAKAANTNVGNISKSGKALNSLPGSIDKGTAAVSKLQGAFSALTVFAISWEIGTIIHDKIVEPIMKARHEADMLRRDHEDTMKRDLSKRSEAQLKKDIGVAKKVTAGERKAIGGMSMEAAARGGFGMGMFQSKHLEKREAEISRLQYAASRRRELEAATKQEQSFAGAPVWGTTSTSHTERTEMKIILDDRTGGKAKVETKGNIGGNVQLQHTGAGL